MTLHPGAFLDRDGTINVAVVRGDKAYPPPDLASFRLLPGAGAAIRDLAAAGYVIVVVTNQPDVRTGAQPLAVCESMNQKLLAELPIAAVKACYHVDSDSCACRKPKSGMLRQAAAEFGIDLARSVMVGDSWRDVGAGQDAGCTTFFIDGGYGERPDPPADFVVSSLAEAARLILARADGEAGARQSFQGGDQT